MCGNVEREPQPQSHEISYSCTVTNISQHVLHSNRWRLVFAFYKIRFLNLYEIKNNAEHILSCNTIAISDAPIFRANWSSCKVSCTISTPPSFTLLFLRSLLTTLGSSWNESNQSNCYKFIINYVKRLHGRTGCTKGKCISHKMHKSKENNL